MISYKFPLHPSIDQENRLGIILCETRHLYNYILETTISRYNLGKKYLREYDINRLLPKIKSKLQVSFASAQTCQLVSKRLYLAMQSFFRRLKEGKAPGFPRFKSAGRWCSFGFPQYNSGFYLHDGQLWLYKVGFIKINLHRPIEGKIKTCEIKRDKLGRWWATFVVEQASQKLSPNKRAVGIDLGLTKIFTLSDGRHKKRPEFLYRVTKRLVKTQRRMSYCLEKLKKLKPDGLAHKQWKGRFEKHRRVLNHIWDKINNQRHNFCHQFSRKIVDEFGTICLEDFKPKDLIARKTNPAKGIRASLRNACLTKFKNCLTYKAENAGRKLILVNPAYTTRTCSNCGEIQDKLPLNQRKFSCSCGLELDRDVNAAKTILKIGLAV